MQIAAHQRGRRPPIRHQSSKSKARPTPKYGRIKNVFTHQNRLSWALFICCVWLATIGHHHHLAYGQMTSSPAASSQLLDSKLVNLNDILSHQQALTEQCRQLEAEKLVELRELIKFSDELGADLQLQDQIVLKMPAICLMLIGPPQFGQDGFKPASSSGPSTTAGVAPLRLDLVNWIYDYDDLQQVMQHSNSTNTPAAAAATGHNKSKRQASSLLAQGAAQNSAGLLNDYWLDLNKLDSNDNIGAQNAQLSPGELEKVKFHEQMEKMLADDRFKAAIKQMDGNKIAPYLSPVILVPGLAGSRLQARVVASKPKVNIICSRQSGWQDMWLSLRSFLPVAIDCWIDNARMELDPATGFTRDAPGVESRVPDFGSVESVRHLDVKSPKLTKYFHAIIERYEQLGYQADKNLFAAPYDFRLAPQQLEETFFAQLKQLIEFAHSNNGQTTLSQLNAATRLSTGPNTAAGKKVTLVCHSMGCTHLLIFLRRQTGAWRQSRIRKLIALSSPWGGTVKALKALLVGEQFGLPLVSEVKMRKLARTFPGVAYMMPQPEVFAQPNKNEAEFAGQVLVQTPQRQFAANQMDELLQAAGMEQQLKWFQQTTSLIAPLNPLPDVHVDCLHSLNIPTPETIIFRNSSDFPDGNYELVQGDGDGTVNHQSLLVCGSWASLLPDRVQHKVVMNTNHVGILSHKSTLEHIMDDVLANN